MATFLPAIKREELGHLLSEALKRYCEGEKARLAARLIRQLRPEVWQQYLDVVWKGYDGLACTSEEMITNSLRLSSVEDWLAPEGDDVAGMLHSTFKLFTEGEWLGYAAPLFRLVPQSGRRKAVI